MKLALKLLHKIFGKTRGIFFIPALYPQRCIYVQLTAFSAPDIHARIQKRNALILPDISPEFILSPLQILIANDNGQIGKFRISPDILNRLEQKLAFFHHTHLHY
ncbi:hypothetical protein LOC54_04515 [Acetobacter sp. AN02]|uniref:hypothetical protein n=1 Tax=Acetobacter sp. AN02 TaxID=2894186 RepID=UPI002434629C|nr:hypothetical protein [Acetobacter sp. AN02]MDG6094381.1 hypothetical protein [Acetobacter sp. AN02]